MLSGISPESSKRSLWQAEYCFPQRYPHPILQNLQIRYRTWKRDTASAIKLRAVRWERSLGHLAGPVSSQGGAPTRTKQEVSVREDAKNSSGGSGLSRSQGTRAVSRTQKRQGNGFSPTTPRRNSSADTQSSAPETHRGLLTTNVAR